jgi:hypothetical protein
MATFRIERETLRRAYLAENATTRDRHAAHRKWCSQLIDLIAKHTGVSVAGHIPFSKKAVAGAIENGEGHLNELPLQVWDSAASTLIRLGAASCLSDGVCVLKEAARQRYEASKEG